MASSSRVVPGRIFISYRREDTGFPAAWLFDRLAERFGRDQVFKDVDAIQLGDDFVKVINAAVGSCEVLLAVIGERWLAISDEQGRRRLDNPADLVRLEIEAALARDVLVIPILAGGARMPAPGELPASLAALAGRQAMELRPEHFSDDIARLLAVLETIFEEPAPTPSPPPPNWAGFLLFQMDHGASVRAVAFSPNSAFVATGSGDWTARLWETATGEEWARMECNGIAEAVAFSSDGMVLAARVIGKTVWLWHWGDSGRPRVRLEHDDVADAMAFSPDGTLLATGCRDKMARLWQTATGRELTPMAHDDWVTTVAFRPDGTLLATGSSDRTVRLWETATGRELARMQHGGAVQAVAFSPDGALLATADQTDEARIWDVATNRERARLDHGHPVRTIVFGPDGTMVATATVSESDRAARIWQTVNGRELARLDHDGSVQAVAFSPDSLLVATGSSDRTARIWHTATFQELARLDHDGRVNAVAFNPGGTLVATADEGGKARLWDTREPMPSR